MNKFYRIFTLLICCLVSLNTAKAQLATLELVSPDPVPSILFPGTTYDFVYHYNYLFTSDGSDQVDPSSVVVTTAPDGCATIVNTNVSGADITVSIDPQVNNCTISVQADDSDSGTSKSIGNETTQNLVVPVEFHSYSATSLDKAIQIDWATSTEVDNKTFELEKSMDGRNFDYVEEVRGAGNSTTLQTYTLMDENPQNGENYFRIKQIDNNGNNSFTPVFSTRFAANFDVEINPSLVNKGELSTIAINSDKKQPMEVSVYTVSGQLVSNNTFSLTEGVNQVELPQANLVQGMYLVHLYIGGSKVHAQKIMVQ